MKDLINTFHLLNGQIIETEGIAWFEKEDVSICLSKSNPHKGFWLEFGNVSIVDYNDKIFRKASGQRFVVKGTIDVSEKGHLGSYLATIKNVYYLKSK